MKRKLFITAAVLIAVIMLLAATSALVDFGGFSGDTDYGGDWGSSSGSDSDWGSSWGDSDGGWLSGSGGSGIKRLAQDNILCHIGRGTL